MLTEILPVSRWRQDFSAHAEGLPEGPEAVLVVRDGKETPGRAEGRVVLGRERHTWARLRLTPVPDSGLTGGAAGTRLDDDAAT